MSCNFCLLLQLKKSNPALSTLTDMALSAESEENSDKKPSSEEQPKRSGPGRPKKRKETPPPESDESEEEEEEESEESEQEEVPVKRGRPSGITKNTSVYIHCTL